ncbi:hypothetical protein IFM46972_07678 [Aspergillus udagawae]|uniref:Uncharacterized protein n=1 Tax=Aspergillus udagawae TaxID=91492 RepID=A0A8H3S0N8_9EURO|nr:hypothetical protein IFM46972_07678 [Aspergillus udagawae]
MTRDARIQNQNPASFLAARGPQHETSASVGSQGCEWEVPLHHMAQERQVGFADEQLPRPVV